MSVTIKINTVDRTNQIDWRSVKLERKITSQVDSLNFVVKRYGSKTFKPALLDNVELFDGATKLFGGKIVTLDDSVDAARMNIVRVTAKDHAHEMDSRLVVNSYENKTIDFIINDIVTTYLPAGFTQTNVNAPITIGFIAFNYEQPSKCFQQLAELVAYDWYVDPDKDIHFFAKATTSAPFNLTDTNGKYDFNSLQISRDVRNLRNTVFVRGGQFSGTYFEEIQEADPEADTYTFGFKYKSAEWYVDRGSGFVAETFGIDNITDPTTVDWVYNFQEKAMKLASGTRPTTGDRVKLAGLPQIPVIIKAKENTSITNYGAFEFKVIDKSIDSKQGARDRAQQEFLQWAEQINEGSFTTHEAGLDVGQQINVQSTIRALNENFIISRIESRMHCPTEFVHNITLMTTQTFGAVEFLQMLLIKKDKEIEVDPNEVLDEVESVYESIKITDVAAVNSNKTPKNETINVADPTTPQALNYPVEFVLAPCPATRPPSGFKREFQLNRSPLGVC